MAKYNTREVLAKRKATTKAPTFSKPHTRPRHTARVIRIVEAHNVYYHANHSLAHDDLTTCTWYSKAQLRAMEHANLQVARSLKMAEKASSDPHSWSRCLFRVFRALQHYDTSAKTQQEQQQQQVKAIIDAAASHIHLDETVTGLEGVIVTPVSKDAVARRNAILSILQKQQRQRQRHAIDKNNTDNNERIAAAIRAETQVAGWYAQVLAKASATWQKNHQG